MRREKHGAGPQSVQNPQGIAVNSFLFEENLQLGNRPFYDLFGLVIGCCWSCAGSDGFHGLFPDFPGEFPPAFRLQRASTPLFLTFVSDEVYYSGYDVCVPTPFSAGLLQPSPAPRHRYLASLQSWRSPLAPRLPAGCQDGLPAPGPPAEPSLLLPVSPPPPAFSFYFLPLGLCYQAA